MNENTQYNQLNGYVSEEEQQRQLSKSLSGVFGWMLLGLAVSAATAFFVLSSPDVAYTIATSSMLFYGLLIGELVLVVILSARISKMSTVTAGIMFFLYAIVNGITLSMIFFVYSIGVIGTAFLSAACMFGVMAIYGNVTKRNLTSIGSFAMMGLVGIIIASVVNMFLGNGLLDLIISYVGIVVFLALTAYDTQKIKSMLQAVSSNDAAKKVMIMGALTLYLDFINIFLKLLNILGRKR